MIKKILKTNDYALSVVIYLLYSYLQIVYFTTRWKFIQSEDFLAHKGTIFIFWHNRLAIGPGMFRGHKDVYALISPHSDGKIISRVVNKFGFGVINGSTNKNSAAALKVMLKKLVNGSTIVVTPDGPRGPVYQINSSITKVAFKYNIQLIPISCTASKSFLLNSWDKLIIPLPFGRITVRVGGALALTGNESQDDANLVKRLTELGSG